jgi:hypothetical protein
MGNSNLFRSGVRLRASIFMTVRVIHARDDHGKRINPYRRPSLLDLKAMACAARTFLPVQSTIGNRLCLLWTWCQSYAAAFYASRFCLYNTLRKGKRPSSQVFALHCGIQRITIVQIFSQYLPAILEVHHEPRKAKTIPSTIPNKFPSRLYTQSSDLRLRLGGRTQRR